MSQLFKNKHFFFKKGSQHAQVHHKVRINTLVTTGKYSDKYFGNHRRRVQDL